MLFCLRLGALKVIFYEILARVKIKVCVLKLENSSLVLSLALSLVPFSSFLGYIFSSWSRRLYWELETLKIGDLPT